MASRAARGWEMFCRPMALGFKEGLFVWWANERFCLRAPNKKEDHCQFAEPLEAKGSDSESEGDKGEWGGGDDEVALLNAGLFESIFLGAGPDGAEHSYFLSSLIASAGTPFPQS